MNTFNVSPVEGSIEYNAIGPHVIGEGIMRKDLKPLLNPPNDVFLYIL